MKSKKFIAVAISIVLLSLGWLGVTGLPLLVALVPLLWISHVNEDSRRGWWSMFGYALLTFVGWNLSTIWWIGYATPVGPFAATLASSFYSMLAFMIFHSVSKRAPKALAYTVLTSLWIAFEYNYTVSEFSWPWLLLGNGFSNDIWAIQWYEYTGIFGGSLWVWLSNITIFEAVISEERGVRRWVNSAVVTVVPLAISLVIYLTYKPAEGAETIDVTVVQPNVDCYDKFAGTDKAQESNIAELLDEVPSNSEIVLLPETSLPGYYRIKDIKIVPFFRKMAAITQFRAPGSTIIAGTNTIVNYKYGEQTSTARSGGIKGYYDVFNSAISIQNDIEWAELVVDHRHKARLVIGVENTPSWVFKVFKFFVIDIGGLVGQIGMGTTGEPFVVGDREVKVGGAICYEGLYGNFMGEFTRGGAELLTIISNDGWWGDTPGHRHLYSLSQVRAIEQRRDIARSANTGISGFITARGESIGSMEWEERGVMTRTLTLNSELTIYAIYGDYIARVMCFVALLSLLYYVAYRARKRHYLA